MLTAILAAVAILQTAPTTEAHCRTMSIQDSRVEEPYLPSRQKLGHAGLVHVLAVQDPRLELRSMHMSLVEHA
jgi:hypothetical protein